MPSKNFNLIVRSGSNEAQVVESGTKRDMITQAEELGRSTDEFEFIGVCRRNAEPGVLGELVHTAYYTDPEAEQEAVAAPVAPTGDTKARIAVDGNTVDWTLNQMSKIRITPKVGVFRPIGLFRTVASVDGVDCLVTFDLEYKKDRFTPLSSIDTLEVKSTRYVEFTLELA